MDARQPNSHRPTDRRPSLLVTRPEPQASEFAGAFRLRMGGGWPVVIAPLMVVRPGGRLPDPRAFDALIFTSQTAVAVFAGQSRIRDLPVFCVGPETAAAARRAGFAATIGPGDAHGLLSLLAADPVRRGWRYLHPGGRDLSAPPAGGLRVTRAAIYAQEPMALTASASALLAGPAPVLLPLFSPRSARLFGQAAPQRRAGLRIAALSPAVALEATALGPAEMLIATRPDAPAMLDSLARLAVSTGPG